MDKSLFHIAIDSLTASILNNLEEGLLIIDKSTKICFANSTAEAILELSGEDLTGKTIGEVVKFYPSENLLEDPSALPLLVNSFVKVMQSGSGKEYLVEIKIAVLSGAPYNLQGYSVIIKDVGEKVNYTSVLEKSEKKYRSLFENALEGIIIMDDASSIVDVNPAACRIYGLSKKEFTSLNIHALFPHKTVEEAAGIWKEFMHKGKLNGFYKFKVASGDYRYIDFKAKTNFIAGHHLAVFSDVTEKRKTEVALRQSESQLKAIFDSSSHRIVLVDLDFRIITFNINAKKASKLNFDVELKPGMNLLDAFPATPEYLTQVKVLFEKAKKGETVSFEYRVESVNADYWIEVTIGPVYNEKRQIDNICITSMDISYRKSTEKVLAESEARFRSLVQNSSDVILILSEDFTVNYISSTVVNVLGYEEEGLIGKNLLDFIFPDDIIKLREAMNRIRQGACEFSTQEFRVLHAEGFFVFLETVLKNQLNNVHIKGILLNARDITERKFQEESLLLLERAIDSSHNGIIITDPSQIDNPVIYVNKAFEKITGYDYLEIIGKNCRILQGDDFNQPELKKVRKALKEQKAVNVRIRNYRKDGELFWNDLSLSPVFNRKGDLTNYIGVLNDITERKIAEDTLMEISHGIASVYEKEYFEAIARHLSYSLHMEAIIIGEVEDKFIKSKVFFCDGQFKTHIKYLLDGMPCEKVIQNGRAYKSSDLTKEFSHTDWVKDGYKNYVGVPLFSSSGKLLGLICALTRAKNYNHSFVESVLNIFSVRTAAELEREQYLTTLQESESKFRSLAENSPDLILIVDLEGDNIIYANKKNFFGYKIKEFDGLSILLDLIHPDDRKKAGSYFNKISTGKAREGETVDLRISGKNKTTEWVSIYHIFLDENLHKGGSKVLINLNTITERKKAEEALRESEDRLLALIENTTDLLWSVDSQLQFTTMNSAFQKFLKKNYGVTAKIGYELGKVFPENEKENWLSLHEKALKGERFASEIEINSGGTMFSYEVSYNPIYSDTGKVSGVSVFARDITRRKIAENDIIRTNFELDSFVYRASHDLRAPLRSVLGLVNLVKVEKENELRANYLKLIDKSIAKLDTFITDLTNFSRNSRLDLIYRKIDFEQILDECIDHLKYMEKADRIQIKKSISEEEPFYSDPIRISIIIQNLISNAIKYQNEYVPDSFCEIKIITMNQSAEISISDNGKGIKAEYMDKIFNMFFRASQDSYGSGLGLYITKQVVDKLQGKILVNSSPGLGTEFKVILPGIKRSQKPSDKSL